MTCGLESLHRHDLVRRECTGRQGTDTAMFGYVFRGIPVVSRHHVHGDPSRFEYAYHLGRFLPDLVRETEGPYEPSVDGHVRTGPGHLSSVTIVQVGGTDGVSPAIIHESDPLPYNVFEIGDLSDGRTVPRAEVHYRPSDRVFGPRFPGRYCGQVFGGSSVLHDRGPSVGDGTGLVQDDGIGPAHHLEGCGIPEQDSVFGGPPGTHGYRKRCCQPQCAWAGYDEDRDRYVE